MYGLCALPGFAVAFSDGELMPPLLGSALYTIVAILNGASCFAKLPTGKEWRWQPFGGSDADSKKKVRARLRPARSS